MKAVAGCVMAASGYAAPPRAEALARDAWLDRRGDLSIDKVATGVLAGLATWHLVDVLRSDHVGMGRVEVKPYTVTVICSHPGNLNEMFPPQATLRFIYRADGAGVIDDAMAAAIVDAVDGASTLVWVDQDGLRTAPARQP